LWDAAVRERGKWTFYLDGGAHDINFSPDSKRLVSVSRGTVAFGTNNPERACIVRLWAVDERLGLLPLATATNSAVGLNFCASFSPDGNLVAVDDDINLRFLDVPTLKVTAQAGHSRPCFAPDGRWLLYAQGNKIFRSDSSLKSRTVF